MLLVDPIVLELGDREARPAPLGVNGRGRVALVVVGLGAPHLDAVVHPPRAVPLEDVGAEHARGHFLRPADVHGDRLVQGLRRRRRAVASAGRLVVVREVERAVVLAAVVRRTVAAEELRQGEARGEGRDREGAVPSSGELGDCTVAHRLKSVLQ